MEELIHIIVRACIQWGHAISDPKGLLGGAVRPSDDQISRGLEFILVMALFAAFLATPLALRAEGGLGEKTGAAFNGLLGIVTSAVVVLAWHLPFVWLGGRASFAGTYLAYCYGAGPFVPLTALATLIAASGLPAEALKHAINPATAAQAFANAKNDPDASTGNMAFGGCLVLVVMAVSVVVTFRCMSFVHSLYGWRLAASIVLSLIISAPLSSVLMRVGRLFVPSSSPAGTPAAVKVEPPGGLNS